MVRTLFAMMVAAVLILPQSIAAQDLAVPVLMIADEDLDTCAFGAVSGLDPQGDNFLAVREGPGTDYLMIDQLHTDDPVWMFNQVGDWVGIVYGVDEVSCSPVVFDTEYTGPGYVGWVHGRYLTVIAG